MSHYSIIGGYHVDRRFVPYYLNEGEEKVALLSVTVFIRQWNLYNANKPSVQQPCPEVC